MIFLPKNLGQLPTLADSPTVRVQDEGGGIYRVWTFNGRMLVVVRGQHRKEQDWEHLAAAPNGRSEGAVHAERWRHIFRLPEKKPNDVVAFTASEDEVTLCTQVGAIKGTFSMEHVPTVWPRVEDLLSATPPRAKVSVDADDLMKLLKLVRTLGCEQVAILCYDKMLGLVAQNDERQCFDGLLVPLEQ